MIAVARSLSWFLAFHHILNKSGRVLHSYTTMSSDQIVAIMTVNKIAFGIVVASGSPFVAMLTSSPMMWHKYFILL